MDYRKELCIKDTQTIIVQNHQTTLLECCKLTNQVTETLEDILLSITEEEDTKDKNILKYTDDDTINNFTKTSTITELLSEINWEEKSNDIKNNSVFYLWDFLQKIYNTKDEDISEDMKLLINILKESLQEEANEYIESKDISNLNGFLKACKILIEQERYKPIILYKKIICSFLQNSQIDTILDILYRITIIHIQKRWYNIIEYDQELYTFIKIGQNFIRDCTWDTIWRLVQEKLYIFIYNIVNEFYNDDIQILSLDIFNTILQTTYTIWYNGHYKYLEDRITIELDIWYKSIYMLSAPTKLLIENINKDIIKKLDIVDENTIYILYNKQKYVTEKIITKNIIEIRWQQYSIWNLINLINRIDTIVLQLNINSFSTDDTVVTITIDINSTMNSILKKIMEKNCITIICIDICSIPSCGIPQLQHFIQLQIQNMPEEYITIIQDIFTQIALNSLYPILDAANAVVCQDALKRVCDDIRIVTSG